MNKPTSFIHPKTRSTRANFDNVTFSIPAGISGKIFIDCHLENCTFVYEGEFFNLRDVTENCVVQTCVVMKKGEKMQTMVSFGLTETQDLYITKLPTELETNLMNNGITYPEVPRPAIAPPVAAGSVDTVEFAVLLEFYGRMYPQGDMARTAQAKAAIIGSITAWGAQQLEAGRQEGFAHMEPTLKRNIDAAQRLLLRAEKAEADLKARDFFVDVMNCQVKKAEARVKDLEAKLSRFGTIAHHPV